MEKGLGYTDCCCEGPPEDPVHAYIRKKACVTAIWFQQQYTFNKLKEKNRSYLMQRLNFVEPNRRVKAPQDLLIVLLTKS